MTEDEMYDIIYGYEDSERDFCERNIELEGENAKLRELVIRMHPTCIQGKRCTFADKTYIVRTMRELGIEVSE